MESQGAPGEPYPSPVSRLGPLGSLGPLEHLGPVKLNRLKRGLKGRLKRGLKGPRGPSEPYIDRLKISSRGSTEPWSPLRPLKPILSLSI
jgi:hypothetical protein